MNEKSPQQLARLLIKVLEARAEDRGFMADLRRGFNPNTEYKAWPHLAKFCDLTNNRMRVIYRTVAAAYATHPQQQQNANIGSVLRLLAFGSGKPGDDALASFDGRLRRLLICDDVQEVCSHLGPVIRAAAAKNISIDYETLFCDLCYWSQPCKLRWAASYYASTVSAEPEDAA